MPLSIAEIDNAYLQSKGISFDGVLVRKNAAFDYLLEKSNKFAFGTKHPK